MNLQSVSIPDSVTTIEGYAFNWCRSLKNISISKNVTKIGEAAFKDSGLEKVDFNPSIKTISVYTFYNCDKLKEITIPDGVTKISELAFGECESLQNVTVPTSVTEIGDRAFDLDFEYNPLSVMVHCKEGSVMEQYAKEHGLNYCFD